jgi:hypothetical protein
MKIKLKRGEVLTAEVALQLMNSLDLKSKPAYIAAKNLRLNGYEADDVRKAQRLTPKDKERSKEYDGALNDIVEKYGKRDEEGKLIQSGPNVAIGDRVGYNTARHELNEEYDDIVAEREKHAEDVETMLDEVIEVELHSMSGKLLPKKLKGAAFGPLVELYTDMGVEETIDPFAEKPEGDDDDDDEDDSEEVDDD